MKIRALALALTLAAGGARADGAWLSEVRDERGRVVGVVPRQNTTIAMLRETVSLVPYLQGADVLLYCNVRYTFTNQGPAAPLLVGFPEMRGRLVHQRCTYPCDPDRVTPHTVIETFAADVAGRALPVQTQPGTEDYARWFVFTVPFANGETSLRNLYVAHPGSTSVRSNTSASLDYRAEYILHTGSQWAGAIGQGDVFLWDGGLENLRHFEALRPTRDDDVQAPLHITVQPTQGRPLFRWDYGNGRQFDTVPPRLENASVVQQSSSAPDAGVAHLGAMALDGDPTTAWIDQGAQGGVGEWLQIPTHRRGRLRGLVVRPGETSAGVARVRRMRLVCFDLEGNDHRPTELESQPVELTDRPGEQRIVFPRPIGACHAVRLTIEQLYGPAGSHGSLADVAFIE